MVGVCAVRRKEFAKPKRFFGILGRPGLRPWSLVRIAV